MGVNNKQRRAAKRHKRARARGGQQSQRRSSSEWGSPFGSEDSPFWSATDDQALADLLVGDAVRSMAGSSLSPGAARSLAESLRAPGRPSTSGLERALLDLSTRMLLEVVRGGWSPTDLVELVRRRGDVPQAAALTALLKAQAARIGLIYPEWRLEVDRLEAGRLAVATLDGFASVLRVAALLAVLPELPVASRRTARSTMSEEDSRTLAKVRALLAKAESTEHDEEAEALSAKAQELISRHALQRLLEREASPGASRTAQPGVAVRRIWLDPPYLLAKASLVHAVADANRCRSVVVESLGLCTVVGDERDLVGVELLVTSLLVQAGAAMLRHGRQVDYAGVSRTRSFRQSFLTAFATRIGHRLRAATQHVVDDADPDGRLLPALRDQESRVRATFESMFPHVVAKESSISNGLGWAAGQAAADLADLDVRSKIPHGAESSW